MSSDRKTVSIGTLGYDEVNGVDSGRVQVYAYNESHRNQLEGADIEGESAGDNS